MQRTFLVPIHPVRTYLPAGVLMGLLGAGILYFVPPIMVPWLGLTGQAVLVAVSLLPLYGLSVLMAMVVPSVRAHLGAQAAGLVGLATASLLYEHLHEPDGGAWVARSAVVWAALAALAVVLVGLVISTCVWLALRLLRFRPRADEPSLCPMCVYEYGTSAVNCPECGTPREPRRYRFGAALWLLTLLRRWGALGVGVALIAVAVVLGPRVMTATIPSLRVHHALANSELVSPWFAADIRDDSNDAEVCVWIPEGAGRDRGLLVQCAIQQAGPSKMLLTVWPRPSTTWYTRPGNMRVESRLDAIQAQSVVQHGVPPELLRKLYREADGRGWKPAQVQRSEPTYSVDPREFFPAGE